MGPGIYHQVMVFLFWVVLLLEYLFEVVGICFLVVGGLCLVVDIGLLLVQALLLMVGGCMVGSGILFQWEGCYDLEIDLFPLFAMY